MIWRVEYGLEAEWSKTRWIELSTFNPHLANFPPSGVVCTA
jgi:hypothetical protein